MKTILIKEGCPNPVCLGEKGENGVSAVLFDYSEWIEDFGEGAISLLVKRKGDASAYPVVLSTADGIATWTISDTDTAVQGYGKAEYVFTVDDKIAKSAVFSFYVAADLGPAGDPPDPYESWIDTLTALGGETLINAQAAQAAQSGAETAQSNAEEAASEAEASATAAAQSAGSARFSAESALSSADTATAAASAAQESESAASESATQAAASTTSAAQSATAAYDSSITAASFATTAQTAATTATTAAQNASASAQSASGSASSASASATTATNAADSATQSAENATTYATTAQEAAEEAATAVSTIAQYAEEAETSATTATQSASEAANSAEQAEASAQEAATEAAKLNNYLPTDTASGSIASFPDGADSVPVKALTVSLEPVQNLNGQTSPYPAGGGVNKWEPQSGRDNGITFTRQDDDTVLVSGTFTIDAWTYIRRYVSLADSGFAVGDIVTLIADPYGIVQFDDENGNRLSYIGSMNLAVSRIQVPAGTARVHYIQYAASTYAGLAGTTINVVGKYLVAKETVTAWSPYSNICPITGHTACGVWRTGFNVWDEEWEIGGYNITTGEKTVNNSFIRCKNPISVVSGQTYHVACAYHVYAIGKDKDGNCLGLLKSTNNVSDLGGRDVTIPTNVVVMCWYSDNYGTTYNNDISINYPSTDTEYHAYQGTSILIPIGQTVYGATIDAVNGVVTVDRVMQEYDGTETNWNKSTSYPGGYYRTPNPAKRISAPIVSNYARTVTSLSEYVYGTVFSDNSINYRLMPETSTLAEWKAWLADKAANGQPLQTCYYLATPITIDLTDIPTISTLLGTNNIWSDSGDVSVTYRADIQRYIQKMIAEALA